MQLLFNIELSIIDTSPSSPVQRLVESRCRKRYATVEGPGEDARRHRRFDPKPPTTVERAATPTYKAKSYIFKRGVACDAVFCPDGNVDLSVVSKQGRKGSSASLEKRLHRRRLPAGHPL
jgi:hypothetical protein